MGPTSSIRGVASTRPESVIRQKNRGLTRGPNSMVASAMLMTGSGKAGPKIRTEDWMKAAWDFYDEVGELRAGITWKANALSRVNLVAAIPPEAQGDEPTPIDVNEQPGYARAVELVEQIAGGVAGQGQLLAAMCRLLEVAGVAYVLAPSDPQTDQFGVWRALSADEVQNLGGGYQVRDAETGEWVDLAETDLLIKCWQPHPRYSWQPDSPVRGVLSTLGEIKMLSQRIMADARSRLAGNGLLVIPEEAVFPPGQGVNGEGDGDTDEFIETLIQVTTIPISDQSSPAATTPLVVRMPGDFIAGVQHIKFYSDFSAGIEELRQSAVRRLALGLDMPPDVLLGLADMNHWNGWLSAEQAITMHIEPRAELIVHALTVGFLRPALKAEGIDPNSVIVWYDTSDLSTRPDLTAAANAAHERRVIGDEAWLGYIGLDAADLLDWQSDEYRRRVLLDVARGAPTLAPAMLAAAGILEPEIADAADEALTGTEDPASAPESDATREPAMQGPPERDDDAQRDDGVAAAALLAAADGIVDRAMERAGQRLRAALGKGKPGGAEAIACPDPTVLHCEVDATTVTSIDHLLAGAWSRVPAIADRYGIGADSLRSCLDSYCRALLAAGHAHDLDRLSMALGVSDDRRVGASH